MTVYIGVDFHPYEQTVAYASDEDGEIGYRRFLHGDKQSISTYETGSDVQYCNLFYLSLALYSLTTFSTASDRLMVM